jgi:hypothetical protein
MPLLVPLVPFVNAPVPLVCKVILSKNASQNVRLTRIVPELSHASDKNVKTLVFMTINVELMPSVNQTTIGPHVIARQGMKEMPFNSANLLGNHRNLSVS